VSAILLLWLLLFPPTARAATSTETGHRESVRKNLLSQINTERSSHGRSALRHVPALTSVAQARAEEIASEGSENGASEKEIVERLKEAGYRPRVASEVVLESEGEADPGSWRDSPQDLLSEEYRDVGIGVVEEEGFRLTVFLFALSWKDFFEKESADLGDLERVRREMLERVNRERRAKRLPPLRESRDLTRAAQSHADDMARRSYYGHRSPEGRMVLERVVAQGYQASTAAENLAAGQFSVEEVMDGWMASPRHQENVLNRLITEAGFGVAFGEQEGKEAVLWVQVFARPRS